MPTMDWSERAVIARDRLARRLADEQHPYPEFAACLLVARGARRMTVEEFAALAGVTPELLAGLESGERSPTEAGERLIELADENPPDFEGDIIGL